jgi:hypothetical protein
VGFAVSQVADTARIQRWKKTMISLLLASYITTQNGYATRSMTPSQVRRRSHQIVQMLKRQDPKVLRSVMYYMGWVPKIEYKRQKCKKNIKLKTDPIDDILMDAAGFPSAGPRKRK